MQEQMEDKLMKTIAEKLDLIRGNLAMLEMRAHDCRQLMMTIDHDFEYIAKLRKERANTVNTAA